MADQQLDGGAALYSSQLLSFSLDRLKKEPKLLAEEELRLQRALQTTATAHYDAFIKTASCLQTIDTELNFVCGHLDHLLQVSCLDVVQATLLELLEVPQLMDTCVRNGVYDEALDLQAFVGRMGLLHPDVPLVNLLMTQVAEVGQTMLQQLMSRLKASIQLPECLRIMGYLRRMAVFSEADLRLQFLQCRDEWISSLIDELDDTQDAYEHVKHLTDIHRLYLFDAIMQYRAIFFGGGSSVAGATGTGPGGQTQSAATASLLQNPTVLATSIRESSMLHSWVQHRLSLYLDMLRRYLPLITEGGNLASMLEHCMYCGSSLSRVGLDFQGLLQPLFETCSLGLLAQHLAGAVEVFNTRLESHKWVSMPAPVMPKSRHHITRTTSSNDGNSAATHDASHTGEASPRGEGNVGVPHEQKQQQGPTDTEEQEDQTPPYQIMEHVPLAVFTNGVLTALNELRHCALLGLSKPAASLLQQSLDAVAASLMHYRHTRALSDSEAALFASATKAMLDTVLPYLASCFTRIFTGGFSRLDTSGTASILRSLLQEYG
ncbi:component of oligomeric golgi complex 8 [Dunaliella salina]|uniref:Conserved oligomeric Golgi complex subunit 8 n=1 Tax=Dunaliella salina TaxID=3046 RepID=A0ABQ7H117_DUNSA|nr:component of oligomeric golgi complex 8 [Dunaliella salina]|eukprot:KAF5840552.1 component of oligomeric golgi complex 8 [Dunaliella salina]